MMIYGSTSLWCTIGKTSIWFCCTTEFPHFQRLDRSVNFIVATPQLWGTESRSNKKHHIGWVFIFLLTGILEFFSSCESILLDSQPLNLNNAEWQIHTPAFLNFCLQHIASSHKPNCLDCWGVRSNKGTRQLNPTEHTSASLFGWALSLQQEIRAVPILLQAKHQFLYPLSSAGSHHS